MELKQKPKVKEKMGHNKENDPVRNWTNSKKQNSERKVKKKKTSKSSTKERSKPNTHQIKQNSAPKNPKKMGLDPKTETKRRKRASEAWLGRVASRESAISRSLHSRA